MTAPSTAAGTQVPAQVHPNRAGCPVAHDVVQAIFDPERYASGAPHEAFAEIRKAAPVCWVEEPDGGAGFWAVTRYADVVEVSRHPEVFSSWRGTALVRDLDQEALEQQRLMLLNMDPPEHTRLRSLVNRGFTPRMVAQLDAKIREVCDAVLDRISEAGTAELVRDIAADLPLAVIAELMGVPHEDRFKIFDWSNKLVGFDDPEFQGSLAEGQEAAMQMYLYANELAAAKRSCPADGSIVSKLITPDETGEVLDEVEFDVFFLLLAVAGNETTRNGIAGGMLTFFDHPDQWQRLLEDRSLLPTAVDEVLRYCAPVNTMRRTATRDTELGGVRIREGEKVVVFYSSANRDEAVFADPSRFDIRRDPNDHLGFGGGPHFCLGAYLARLEAQVAIGRLVERFDELALVSDTVEWGLSLFRVPGRLPLRFRVA